MTAKLGAEGVGGGGVDRRGRVGGQENDREGERKEKRRTDI